MKCLVVDDEELIATVLRTHLEGRGHVVAVAADGRAAHDLWFTAEPPFDLLISDIKLPGMSGPDLISAIRRAGDGAPCLLISGHVTAKTLGDALDLGPVAVLAKPFSFTELDARIDDLMGR